VEGASFEVGGGVELEVRSVEWDGATNVRFVLGRDGWNAATRCTLGLAPRRSGSLLEVHHAGFRDVGLDDGAARRLRAGAARTWIGALEQARGALSASHSRRA
jgi:hypothetical protein